MKLLPDPILAQTSPPPGSCHLHIWPYTVYRILHLDHLHFLKFIFIRQIIASNMDRRSPPWASWHLHVSHPILNGAEFPRNMLVGKTKIFFKWKDIIWNSTCRQMNWLCHFLPTSHLITAVHVPVPLGLCYNSAHCFDFAAKCFVQPLHKLKRNSWHSKKTKPKQAKNKSHKRPSIPVGIYLFNSCLISHRPYISSWCKYECVCANFIYYNNMGKSDSKRDIGTETQNSRIPMQDSSHLHVFRIIQNIYGFYFALGECIYIESN